MVKAGFQEICEYEKEYSKSRIKIQIMKKKQSMKTALAR